MNAKNYQRKLRQFKLDKSRKAESKNKYFNQCKNNTYAIVNENEYDYDYTDCRPITREYYDREKNMFEIIPSITICRINEKIVKSYDPYTMEPDEISIDEVEYITLYNKKKGLLYFREVKDDRYVYYTGCIRCNAVCSETKNKYKCLHGNSYYCQYINSDYYTNHYCYDIYNSNLNTGIGLIKNIDDLDPWYDEVYIEDTLYKTKKSIRIRNTIFKFKYTYYCLKFKKQFRDWLWLRVRLPNIEKKYHPQQLNAFIEHCQSDEDLFTTLDTW